MRLGLKFLLLACFAWALTGCGGDDGNDSTKPNVVIESLRFGESHYKVALDETLVPELFVKVKGATAEEKYDLATNPYAITMAADNKSLVTIDEAGVITGVKKGATTLKAHAPNLEKYAWTAIEVVPPIYISKLQFVETKVNCSEATIQPSILCQFENETKLSEYDLEKNSGRLVWSVDKEDIATVSDKGVVTRKNFGVVTLTATSKLLLDGGSISMSIAFLNPDQLWIGQWKLSSWNGHGEAMADKVFLAFDDATNFRLYQSIGDEVGYKPFSGTYKLEGTVLSGKYADNTPWAESYEMKAEEDTLTLTGKTSGAVSIYARDIIPPLAQETATRSLVVPFL